MKMGLFDIGMIISILSPIIPLISLLNRKNRISIFLFQTLFAICFLGLLADIVSYLLAINGIGVDIIFHIYTTLVSIMIFRLYKYEISTSFIKKSIPMVSILFISLSLYFLFFEKGFTEYNPEPYIVLSILTIVLSGYYFYDLFINLEYPKITKHYFFWINSAFFIYFNSTFYITVFEELLVGAKTQMLLWPIQHAATIIFNLMIAKGIWTMKTE